MLAMYLTICTDMQDNSDFHVHSITSNEDRCPPPTTMIHSLQRVIPISERVCLWDNWGITESTFIYLTRLH